MPSVSALQFAEVNVEQMAYLGSDGHGHDFWYVDVVDRVIAERVSRGLVSRRFGTEGQKLRSGLTWR